MIRSLPLAVLTPNHPLPHNKIYSKGESLTLLFRGSRLGNGLPAQASPSVSELKGVDYDECSNQKGFDNHRSRSRFCLYAGLLCPRGLTSARNHGAADHEEQS